MTFDEETEALCVLSARESDFYQLAFLQLNNGGTKGMKEQYFGGKKL